MDADGAAKFYGKEIYNSKRVKFMQIDRMYVDFKLSKSRFRVRDVINNGNIIGESLNIILDSEIREIHLFFQVKR